MYKIAYVAAFDFENGQAAANRFLSLSKVLDKNYQVTKVLTTYPLNNKYNRDTETWKVRFLKKNSFQNLFIVFKLLFFITKNAKRFDTFIIYGGYAFYMFPFIILKPFYRYKLVYDSVEIYLPKTFFRKLFSPSTWNHLLGYDFLIRFFDGAICISSFIQDKHKQQGLKTVVIPPIFLDEKKSFKKNSTSNFNSQKVKLLFYGYPGKKDSLHNLVKVFLLDEPLIQNFEVTIIGLDQRQFEEYCNENGIHNFPTNFVIKGKMLLDEVYDELLNTDFTFLQRPYTITTKAGFPSKLVESLFLGVPSILNLTSDMDKYDVDVCSIVCEDDTVKSLHKSLLMVKSIKDDKKLSLGDKCKTIYNKHFSTQANSDKIKKFIEDVNNN